MTLSLALDGSVYRACTLSSGNGKYAKEREQSEGGKTLGERKRDLAIPKGKANLR
jgi:hypothetical protein